MPKLTRVSGNSTAAKTILKTETPTLSTAQKFAALPQGTKLAIYCGGGAAGAVLLAAFLFTCIRQRRKGRLEREAYNAKVEKEREEAYKDQMELREKGFGGWDNGAYEKQGDDALGGWGGSHIAADAPPMPKLPSNVSVSEVPSRSMSPAIPIMGSPAFPAPQRVLSPPLVSPVPQKAWNGGNVGGMIHGAGNSYSGGYGGSNNIPRSPSYSVSPQLPQPNRGYPGGYSNNGGYQRF